FDSGGNEVPINRFSDSTTLFYAEYGLTDRITAIVSLPFYQRLSLAEQIDPVSGFVFFPGDTDSAFADFSAGVRYALHRGTWVLSTGLQFGFPVANEIQENGLVHGDGELNQLFTLEAGRSFYPKPFYTSGLIGFNNRTEGYSDEFHYLAEAGSGIIPRISLIGRMRGVASFKNGVDETLGGAGGIYSNNQEYLLIGGEVAVALNHSVSISVGAEKLLYGRNILFAPSISFSVAWKR
ncbi:hypothetical protein L0222_31735, partial [bacterium]|nr:hypothetical protein [bacterium]